MSEFLKDLDNQHFIEPTEPTKEEIREQKRLEREQKRAEKEEARQQRALEKEIEKLNKQKQKNIQRVIERKIEVPENNEEEIEEEAPPKNDDEIFSEKPTEILGNERRILLAKITSYKSLFPNELKSFRISKKASNEDLKNAIEEMDSIINTGSLDSFLFEGILSSLKVVEGVSANTRYDISGMVDLLKVNKEFLSICKRLFLKYNVFQATPIEFQAVFIIFSTAMLCRQKNIKRDAINEFLNQPM